MHFKDIYSYSWKLILVRFVKVTPSSVASSVVFPITEELLKIWSNLPDTIKQDPTWAAFQKEYQRLVCRNFEKRSKFPS